MNRILRIVGGPLKGAEIALVAGTRVKVGSGDGCDILVADPTLGKAAFELDVAEDEVTIVTPDGTAKTMLDFEAREFGSSAFAIGPSDGVWQEIVWEKRSQGSGIGDQGSESGEEESGEIPPKTDPLKRSTDERPETEDAKGGKSEEKASRISRLVSLVILAVAVVLVLLVVFCLRCCRSGCLARSEAVAVRQPTLSEVADRYGVVLVETNGQIVVRGNLKTRAERLEATAAVFQAKPGVEVDITDDESLYDAADTLLGLLVPDSSLKVAAATNRVVVLKGNVGSAEFLRGVLAALANDVSGMAKADCRAVVCAGKPLDDDWLSRVPSAVGPAVAKGGIAPVAGPKASVPRLPVCGIVMTPYPCIILKNGARISEGGEFGGYAVVRIGEDSLTLRDGARVFEWKP